MINIKSFAKRRNSTATVTTSSGGTSTNSGTSSPVNDWFYYNDDANAVVCRYDLHSVGNIVAFSYGVGDGGSSSGSGGSGSTVVVDNLTSYNTAYALSANQGRVLKSLIDNIQTQSGGQQFTGTIDWSNVINKPATFPPTSHTHAINDVDGLQTQLTNFGNNISTLSSNIQAHANNSSIHLTATEKNVIDNLTLEQIQFIVQLMSITTIQNGTIRFNANVNATGNVVALQT